ncbi:hypothetical protein [Pseudomonas sp. Q1-7]|nr:hypothetical protein [Pseudomonas sp. Q1-7]
MLETFVLLSLAAAFAIALVGGLVLLLVALGLVGRLQAPGVWQ